jgi:hypothetical protein
MQDYTGAEQLYGPVVARKMREVDEALEAINRNHKQFFAGIPSRVSDEKDATANLQDYVVQDWRPSDGIAGIGFNGELPEAIAKECRDAFNKIINAD